MADIERIHRQTQTIAVLWANPRESAPAHHAPAYMAAQGLRVYPIHVAQVHAGKTLWGMPMLQRLDQIDEPVDLVNVFRRAERIIDFVLMVDHRNLGSSLD